MSTNIEIPVNGWLEALDKCDRLKAVLGHDARFEDGTLSVSLDVVDRAIAHSLDAPDMTPPKEPHVTLRDDRAIALTPEQELELAAIHADHAAAFFAAGGDRALEREAWRIRHWEQQSLRQRAIAPYLRQDASDGFTLVYGDCRPFLADDTGVLVLECPTGRPLTCHTLIHFTHPASPEERAFREWNVTSDRVISYWVEGIDDGARVRLQNPAAPINALSLRRMLAG